MEGTLGNCNLLDQERDGKVVLRLKVDCEDGWGGGESGSGACLKAALISGMSNVRILLPSCSVGPFRVGGRRAVTEASGARAALLRRGLSGWSVKLGSPTPRGAELTVSTARCVIELGDGFTQKLAERRSRLLFVSLMLGGRSG